MPVYSKTIEDKKIKDLVKDKYNNILILGCGSCMNESLAYTNDTPIYHRYNPYSIEQELIRITDMLIKDGYNAKYRLMPEQSTSPCMVKIGEEECFLPDELPDVILILSCPAGRVGLQFVVDSIPIIGIAKSFGFLSYSYEEENGERIMIKDNSKVILLQKE